jgi:hypothetical protein
VHVAETEAPKTMVEWLAGPVAGVAAALFTAGRKEAQLSEHTRRLEALEHGRSGIEAKIEGVRAELRDDVRLMRVELREDMSEIKAMVRRLVPPLES